MCLYHEFRHNIVKVAVDLDNGMAKFIVNNRTDELKTDISFVFYDDKLKLSALVRCASHKL